MRRGLAWLGAAAAAGACYALAAPQPDPFASNNTLYPPVQDWNGGFRPSNFAYPVSPVTPRWPKVRPVNAPLTPKTAPAYVAAVKKYIEKEISGLVNEPMSWTPQQAGWFDMPWGGQGTLLPDGKIDPTSGREALLGSYTGQIIQPGSYPSDTPSVPFQNHAVVYYDPVAGAQLSKIWKNPFKPDLAAAQFPEGSVVVKVESVTLTEEQWPEVLKGSPVSYIYRPAVAAGGEANERDAVITPTRFLQMAVRIKDTVAAPVTGWVFIAFFYDARASGESPWDRTMPVGATWGNDPALARFPDGLGPNGKLKETWVADDLPSFVTDGLGWGGRLAGPLDLGIRHNVVTVSGQRFGDSNPSNPPSLASSSCVSCHISAQYPYVANLYPSPNLSFPPEGGQFLLYDPGSPLWAQWFQNLPGNVALSSRGRSGIVAADYDMMLTFALMRANGSAETDAFIRHLKAGH